VRGESCGVCAKSMLALCVLPWPTHTHPSLACRMDLSARVTVASSTAAKPSQWKLISPVVVRIIPTETSESAAYTIAP
jgi:hypothetical protein